MGSNREWDANFDEYRLTELLKDSDGDWHMHLVRSNGTEDCGFLCPSDSPIVPTVGMTVRLYNALHEARRIRGLVLDGTEVYYRGEEEDRKLAIAERAEIDALLRAEYERLRPELGERIACLPEVLRRRLDRLRANAPETFWRYEVLEVIVLETAFAIRERTTIAGGGALVQLVEGGVVEAEVLKQK